jgi:hypothetical protein
MSFNVIFPGIKTEAFDQPSLYLPAEPEPGISFCTAARNRGK